MKKHNLKTKKLLKNLRKRLVRAITPLLISTSLTSPFYFQKPNLEGITSFKPKTEQTSTLISTQQPLPLNYNFLTTYFKEEFEKTNSQLVSFAKSYSKRFREALKKTEFLSEEEIKSYDERLKILKNELDKEGTSFVFGVVAKKMENPDKSRLEILKELGIPVGLYLAERLSFGDWKPVQSTLTEIWAHGKLLSEVLEDSHKRFEPLIYYKLFQHQKSQVENSSFKEDIEKETAIIYELKENENPEQIYSLGKLSKINKDRFLLYLIHDSEFSSRTYLNHSRVKEEFYDYLEKTNYREIHMYYSPSLRNSYGMSTWISSVYLKKVLALYGEEKVKQLFNEFSTLLKNDIKRITGLDVKITRKPPSYYKDDEGEKKVVSSWIDYYISKEDNSKFSEEEVLKITKIAVARELLYYFNLIYNPLEGLEEISHISKVINVFSAYMGRSYYLTPPFPSVWGKDYIFSFSIQWDPTTLQHHYIFVNAYEDGKPLGVEIKDLPPYWKITEWVNGKKELLPPSQWYGEVPYEVGVYLFHHQYNDTGEEFLALDVYVTPKNSLVGINKGVITMFIVDKDSRTGKRRLIEYPKHGYYIKPQILAEKIDLGE